MVRYFILSACLLLLSPLSGQISFSNYANFHSIGVNFDLPVDDPEGDLSMELSYKKLWESDYHAGFQLTKSNTFNPLNVLGSVLNAAENTSYCIRIELSDPTTPLLNGTYNDTLTTQKMYLPNTFIDSFYVSPDGSGTEFSEENPGNLTDMLDMVAPGDAIILLGGTYKVGNINWPTSGTKDLPILIEGKAAETVIFDGSDPDISWEEDSSINGYKTAINYQDCNVVIADGVRLYPHKSLKELKYHKIVWENQCMDAGVDGFFRSGNNNTLRLKFRNGTSPLNTEVAVGKYNYCFKLTGIEHVIFENIQFRYYGSGKQAAVVLKDASDIRFQTCTFDFNDVGILLSGETNNTIIHHCFFSDGNGDWKFWRMKATYEGVYLPGCSGNNIITDNLPGSTLVNNENNRGLESGGVFISGDFSGKGMIIKSSTFHDIVQGLTMTPQSWWVDSGKSFEFDFYANEVYNCSEDAIEADVFPRNVRIWQNDIHHTNSAISAAPAANGPLLIYNNIIHDLTTDTTLVAAWGETVAGRSLKVQSGSSDTSSSIYFMHNTVDAPWDQYAMDLLKGVGESWHTFRFLNNIWRTNNLPSFRLRANTPGPLTSDFNSLHAYNTSASIIQYLGKDYFDFGTYQDESGLEEHSFYGDPLFSDASNGDYSLKEESPLIDQAVIIPGLNDNGLYCPDIGAIESFDECSVSVHEEDKDVFNLSLFPNPFSSGTLTLKFASPLPKTSQLVIRDMMGRRITSCDLAASMLRMDLELDLPPGIYVCFLQTKASAFLSSRLLCVQ